MVRKKSVEKDTIYQIAEATGVSIATVSRVLNNKNNVATKTRLKVLECIDKYNYIPRLYKKEALSIGLVLEYPGHIMTSYLAEIMNGVSDYIFEHSHRLALFSVFEQNIRTRGLLDYLRENNVDGVVVLMSNDRSEYIYHLEEEQFPYMVVNNRMAGDINYIDIDNDAGIRCAMTHLFELGHRDIAFLNGPADNYNMRIRRQAYSELMAARGIPADSRLLPEEISTQVYGNHLQEGYERTRRLLKTGVSFTALCCSSDDYAFSAIKAIAEAGLRVPQDIAVVGFDDCDMATYFFPTLTTVHQPLYKMGYEAAREVARQVEDREPGTSRIQHVYEPRLIVRNSTG